MSDQKTVATDILKAVKTTKIIIERNSETGEMNIAGDIGDEVLTYGMLAVAKKRLEEHYLICRQKAYQDQMKKALVKPGGLSVQ